jgi:7-carboxy-7-deazaguanine synthase
MKVIEIFHSLQGEGFLAGTPSVFIRLAGCPLRCLWCDTKYAWDSKAGKDYSNEQIVNTVEQFQCRFVVITGGEPMTGSDLSSLTKELKDCGKHITIETSGIAFIPGVECDLMSISPKLSNSVPEEPHLAPAHEDSRLDLAVLRKLIDNYEYQLKFVVDSPADVREITETLKKLDNIDIGRVMLMPQAKNKQELLAKSPMVAGICTDMGFCFSQRLHLLLWDGKKAK